MNIRNPHRMRILLIAVCLFGGRWLAQAQQSPNESPLNMTELAQLDRRVLVTFFFAQVALPAQYIAESQANSIRIAPLPNWEEVLSASYTRQSAQGKMVSRAEEIALLKKARNSFWTGKVGVEWRRAIVQQTEAQATIRTTVRVDAPKTDPDLAGGLYQITNQYAREEGKWRLTKSQWVKMEETK